MQLGTMQFEVAGVLARECVDDMKEFLWNLKMQLNDITRDSVQSDYV